MMQLISQFFPFTFLGHLFAVSSQKGHLKGQLIAALNKETMNQQ